VAHPYADYIPESLKEKLLRQASSSLTGSPRIKMTKEPSGLETTEALSFLMQLHDATAAKLEALLHLRKRDRQFLDARVKRVFELNRELGISIDDPDYMTVMGLEDQDGRIVFGPQSKNYHSAQGAPIAPLPEHLQGPHVTLFGPPDSAKMAINAMNSYHRCLNQEPPLIAKLLESQTSRPFWGADDEDSKTPIHEDLVDASINLKKCFDGTLSVLDDALAYPRARRYELAKTDLAQPIKRFPGLALPCTFLFMDDQEVGLHLYDFGIHLFHNWHNPKALTFYVPKLENEEEAQYIHHMIASAETLIKQRHDTYKLGTVRLMIVLENPRAIVRTNEIMDALYPYFAGASLGWHDFLASTARLYKEDGNYRIPVKADPDIVIKYIKASHRLLADVVGPRGGVKVGGMYGLLPNDTDVNAPSFQTTLRGFFKDVITQLRRDLTGFWVAHPDFMRLGLSIVEAWNQSRNDPQKTNLTQLIRDVLQAPFADEVIKFMNTPDIEGLDPKEPHYARSLVVADIKESDFIANNHPDEIRYNIFQSLQYLADWLAGRGCVALPTTIQGIPVRVMDDLATAERSRWEVWHELYHGRFALCDFVQIVFEEMNFIRKNLSNHNKVVQVACDDRTRKWYPVAMQIMMKLMTDPDPAEFATALLLPFTTPMLRNVDDPMKALLEMAPNLLQLRPEVQKLVTAYDLCAHPKFALAANSMTFLDPSVLQSTIMEFSQDDVIYAASFHGDIGQSAATLDHQAQKEQQATLSSELSAILELRNEVSQYLAKYGFKFLVSAKGKSATELLSICKARLLNSCDEELKNAKQALWIIAEKRLHDSGLLTTAILHDRCRQIMDKHHVIGMQCSFTDGFSSRSKIQTLSMGMKSKHAGPVEERTLFQIASLSKTVASVLATILFDERKISLDTSLAKVLTDLKSPFHLCHQTDQDAATCLPVDALTLRDLLRHTGLSMHYVFGFKPDDGLPTMTALASNPKSYGYDAIHVVSSRDERFHYSGGGFIIIEHIFELLLGSEKNEWIQWHLKQLGLNKLTSAPAPSPPIGYALGHDATGNPINDYGYLHFPTFAAGYWATAETVVRLLQLITEKLQAPAPQSLEEANHAAQHVFKHNHACQLLDALDGGSVSFMGAKSGLGMFIAEAEDNMLALHQGANDGFRALYMAVISGPDVGKSFCILANSDHNAVEAIAEIAQMLLRHSNVSGIDLEFPKKSVGSFAQKKEEHVNQGYKQLIVDHFKALRPAKTPLGHKLRPFSSQNLVKGAKVTGTSNDRFARAENLLRLEAPTFDPSLFCSQGKVMDSWESVRHNESLCDWLTFDLAVPSSIQFIELSTEYHDGNQAPAVKLFGRSQDEGPWNLFCPQVTLAGHSYLYLKLDQPTPVLKSIRVEMFPDGGLSRLGLFNDLDSTNAQSFLPVKSAQAVRFSHDIPKSKKPLALPPTIYDPIKNRYRSQNITSALARAKIIEASNEHYAPASQVLSNFAPLHMFDGMESARSRMPGHHEWVSIELDGYYHLQHLIVDFKYFVNNNPKSMALEIWQDGHWREILAPFRVKPLRGSYGHWTLPSDCHTTRVRLRCIPDGGFNRVQVFGTTVQA
jgi:malate synthase